MGATDLLKRGHPMNYNERQQIARIPGLIEQLNEMREKQEKLSARVEALEARKGPGRPKKNAGTV